MLRPACFYRHDGKGMQWVFAYRGLVGGLELSAWA